MVIDDSRAMRALLGGMLLELGFEIIEAPNGKEAFMVLKAKDPPALILLDWNMPEMNGFDLLQRIRANPAFDVTPIIMVTTETEITQVARALEAGANEYVMKPFTRDVIRDKLQLLGVLPEPAGA
jgi:two-component system chemotaxis response regulator CheY